MTEEEDFSLRPSTLALLRAFEEEQEERRREFEALSRAAHARMEEANTTTETTGETTTETTGETTTESTGKTTTETSKVSMKLFQEDWQLSQFWYSDETALALARESLAETPTNARLGFLAAPSAFVALNELDVGSRQTFLFEFDKRYSYSAGQCSIRITDIQCSAAYEFLIYSTVQHTNYYWIGFQSLESLLSITTTPTPYPPRSVRLPQPISLTLRLPGEYI